MEKVREVGIEPTETEALLLAMAISVFRAAAVLLARDAHPFALTLLCFRGRGLTGSRIGLHTLCRYASGLVLYYCYRVCITHLSLGGVSSLSHYSG